ncbi:hypothetical protein VSS37_05945 [Candidatus Thiothrix sp. Deng01]|uniref:Uncharacterized protein n=1 Tax=Candidatus Thiothrix phosphatis TaxID=3112415 RepID=A0ABU6CUL2_9GAMM|nr:hypothetical protein [Candidatus Thiothrix sp. Deng01]MEB4590514.1 hypothetical protein [Candidatus Thiothrix sp. Deng01]
MAFQPGHKKIPGSGMKKGQKISETAENRQFNRQIFLPLVDEAAQTLLDVMRDTQAPHTARIAAANSILDRALGKPRQEVEHSGDAAQPLEIMIRHFSDEVPNSVVSTELDDQPRII